MLRILLAIACLACCGLGCGNEEGPAGPSVVATEIWSVEIGGGQGHGDFRFTKKSDGSVAVIGDWTFGTVFCPFSSEPGAEIDSTIAFTANGVATDNPDESEFTLTVAGKARNGSASGAYFMVFEEEWRVPGPLTWTASRTSGSGITP